MCLVPIRLSLFSVQVYLVYVAQLRKGGHGRSGGGGGKRVCVWKYYGLRFTVLIQSPILGPSPVPSPTGDWVDKLCGSCGSMNL